MAETELPVMHLKRREEHRLRNGHPWVFSNEVNTAKSPMAQFEPGGLAEVRTSGGRVLGVAQVNPKALICARLVSRGNAAGLDKDWVGQRIASALALRERLYDEPYYRLIYAESDGLPGVVVDRHGEVLVVQLNTLAAQRLQDRVLGTLERALRPRAMVLRNDSPARLLEGMGEHREVVLGTLTGDVEITENGQVYAIDPLEGQKTGWYYDQRDNRARTAHLCRVGAPAKPRVLDLFCYAGGWGIACAAAGASEVLCVDSSVAALDAVRANAERNAVAGKVRTAQADVFKLLRDLRGAGERFDIVIADPPAFVRRRKDLRAGIEAYRRLNGLAMSLLSPRGILVSASCSSHLAEADLLDCVRGAAVKHNRSVRLIGTGQQGADHPILPGMPESRYIKAAFGYVSAG